MAVAMSQKVMSSQSLRLSKLPFSFANLSFMFQNFKMYSTMQQSVSSTSKSQHGGFQTSPRNGGFQSSPRSSVNHRKGGNSPTLGSRSSATKDYDHAILHSQAMIQRSKD